MLKLGLGKHKKASRQNFTVLESILCRQSDFWSAVDDLTIAAMLLKRVHQARGCIDLDEIFEKAEVRLL